MYTRVCISAHGCAGSQVLNAVFFFLLCVCVLHFSGDLFCSQFHSPNESPGPVICMQTGPPHQYGASRPLCRPAPNRPDPTNGATVFVAVLAWDQPLMSGLAPALSQEPFWLEEREQLCIILVPQTWLIFLSSGCTEEKVRESPTPYT